MVGNLSISSSNLTFGSVVAQVEGRSSTQFQYETTPGNPLDSDWTTMDAYQHLDLPLQPRGLRTTTGQTRVICLTRSLVRITGRREGVQIATARAWGWTVSRTGKGSGHHSLSPQNTWRSSNCSISNTLYTPSPQDKSPLITSNIHQHKNKSGLKSFRQFVFKDSTMPYVPWSNEHNMPLFFLEIHTTE